MRHAEEVRVPSNVSKVRLDISVKKLVDILRAAAEKLLDVPKQSDVLKILEDVRNVKKLCTKHRVEYDGLEGLHKRIVAIIQECGHLGLEIKGDFALESNNLKDIKQRLHRLGKAIGSVQHKVGMMQACGDGDEWNVLFWTDRKKALKQLQERDEQCPISAAILSDLYGVEYSNKYHTERSPTDAAGTGKEPLPPFPDEDFETLM
ncbi:hypothetical protein CYMTET_20497 [Cymbomonas tetramitiformis]|uniref:Uncharacterized protein n=1 Tax=Cymbomonas tetramitiformis TaxID=36881 RepID=A0AAE0G462_9CHLO|nr:hypothetical protein CYMTET_20497 [Cymbomonas tetramitiformis]